jgi:tRNA G10  N-methylase Trm11
VAAARDNIAQAGIATHTCVMHADCAVLPVRDASVDVLVCDLPFGKQHGTVEGNKELYPRVLSEAARVVRPGGRAVLLTSDTNADTLLQQVGN